MKKISILILLILIVGCSNTTLEHDEVVAVVKDKEITMGDLRFRSDASDDELIENIDVYIEEELIIQEAKAAEIDVSDEIEEMIEIHNKFSYKNSEANRNEFIEFIESQAERFNMEPEAYFKEYMKRRAERGAYHTQFVKEMFGTPEDTEEGERIYQEYMAFIEGLKERYKDEVEILVE